MATATETKERPILFSREMVRAILDGRKTQTRRMIKCYPGKKQSNIDYENRFPTVIQDGVGPRVIPEWAVEDMLARCPYGQPGDRLWVRETWSVSVAYDGAKPSLLTPHVGEVVYLAGGGKLYDDLLEKTSMDDGEERGQWRPSIFMPRWASRITLEVLGVRMERLQDISEGDARREATFTYSYDPIASHCWYPVVGKVKCGSGIAANARECFQVVWETINGDGSWDANPWVWVVEFRRLQESSK